MQVGIQNNTGAWVSGYPVTRYPNSTSYNLANVDASIKFNTLSAGVYRFIVIASDGYPTNNKTLQAITFVVSAPPAPVEAASTLALSSTRTTINSTINSGALVAVKGTITSNYNITNVQVGFKNSSGAWISGYPASRYPNAKSYDLKNVDSVMRFNALPAGTYTFTVIASDQKQSTKFLQSTTFTVKGTTSTPTVTQPSTNVANNGPFQWPVNNNNLTSWYGYRYWYNNAKDCGDSFHNGIDIGCGIGTPVYAANGGTVITSTNYGSAGEYMIIQDTNGYSSVYMHLSERLKEKGATVKKGDLIAYSGNTGGVPAHLHLEIRRTTAKESTINPISKYQLTDTRWRLTNPNPVYIKQNGVIKPNPNFNYNFSDSTYIGFSDSYRDAAQIAAKAYSKNNFNNF